MSDINKDKKVDSTTIPKSKSLGDKEIVSNVLKQKREWVDSNDHLPDPGQRVVMRLVHESDIDGEDAEKIYPKEDCQIGTYDAEKKIWVVSPPHPKYDYSRLSKHGNIDPQVIVTHWAIPLKDDKIDELNGWDTRYNNHMDYKVLKLIVDPEHEENIYRALLWAANFLVRSAGPDFYDKESEMRKMYEYICDLQWAIDQTQYKAADRLRMATSVFSSYLADAIEEAIWKENTIMTWRDYLNTANMFIEEAGGITSIEEVSEVSEFNEKLSKAIVNYGNPLLGGYLEIEKLVQRIWIRTLNYISKLR